MVGVEEGGVDADYDGENGDKAQAEDAEKRSAERQGERWAGG